MTRIVIFLLSFLSIGLIRQKTDVAVNSIKGITIDKSYVYADSTWEADMLGFLNTNIIVNIIDSTILEHDDEDQELFFKWYQIIDSLGIKSWIHGSTLAIQDNNNPDALNGYIDTIINLGTNYSEARLEYYVINGHLLDYDTSLPGPEYSETYLVLTDNHKNSFPLLLEEKRPDSKTLLRDFYLKKIINDDMVEVVLVSETKEENGKNFVFIQILSPSKIGLEEVFDTKLSLFIDSEEPSPSYSQFIELEPDFIRTEQIKATPIEKDIFELSMTTTSFAYLGNQRGFERLYHADLDKLKGKTLNDAPILSIPSDKGAFSMGIMMKGTVCELMSLYHKDDKFWYKVPLNNGLVGYINSENISILNSLYNVYPVYPNHQYETESFVRFVNF